MHMFYCRINNLSNGQQKTGGNESYDLSKCYV